MKRGLRGESWVCFRFGLVVVYELLLKIPTIDTMHACLDWRSL